jgi:hypothetical protein
MKINGKESVIDSSSNNMEPILAYRFISPIYLDKGNCEVSITSTEAVEIDNLFIYSFKVGEQQKIEDLFASDGKKVNLTYTKNNPTKYAIDVNTSTPFFLVFSESYHKDWVASIEGQHIPDEYHFVANGFANGWYINKTGTFTVTIEFLPQQLFYAGSAISVTTLIMCVVYLSKNKIKIVFQKIARNKISRKDQVPS